MAKIFWVEDQSHWIEKFKPILEGMVFDGKPTEVTTYKFVGAARAGITATGETNKPDIAILDAHMNGDASAGFLVSRSLLAKWPDLPIIFLSEHSGTQTEEMALDHIGIKDFIAKHQRNIEDVLCWRIKANLRQKHINTDSSVDVLRHGKLKIDLATWEVYWQDKKLMNPSNPKRPLAPMPRKILHQLVKHSPRPVSAEKMAEYLDADPERFSYANYRQHIKTLRHSFDISAGGNNNFIEQCKAGQGIVTFGDLRAYCWK